MNIPEAYRDIINGLYQKTETNQVMWNDAPGGDGFIVLFKNYGLTITLYSHGYQVYLISNNGQNIDSFVIEETDEDWSVISSLYAMIHQNVNHIDAVLAEIKTEIANDKVVGRPFNTRMLAL